MSTARPPPTPRAQPDSQFPALKREIIARTGHFYYQDKDDLLWDRVRKRLLATKIADSADYLAHLKDRDQGLAEWTALEAEITIGETFFFRYAEQFTALRDTILPDILARRRDERRLRIWSAGCATGAEPYSISILLHEILGSAIGDWRISILGSDINETFLETARQARFGQWALRALRPDQRARWFIESGLNTWTLRTPYRSLVRFERANLMDLLGPAPPLELVDFDLILCRNVLIYFHVDVVTGLVRALGARLTPQGWLLLGHAEPNPSFGAFLSTLSLPGTVAYRPLEADEVPAAAWPRVASDPTAQAWAPLPVPQATLARSEPPKPPVARQPTIASPIKPLALEQQVETLRSLANAGDYAAASQAREHLLLTAPDNAVVHFYSAMIDQALDHPAKAEDGFRKALYLDPNFVMARYHQGLLRIAQGRDESGRRAIAASAQIAGTLAVDARLPEGAGLTAGELRALARLHFKTRGGD